MAGSELRQRNRRGEGAKLGADILIAAAGILEETASEEAVTLRAIARRIGIAAPSIYEHFPDREAIVEAVLEEAFADFRAVLVDAVASEPEPLDGLRAGCLAYLRFADQRPNRYRILFSRHHLVDDHAKGNLRIQARAEAFRLLVTTLLRCVEAGSVASDDPLADATTIWAGLHGYATLRPSLPGFPWPDMDTAVAGVLRSVTV